MIFQTTVKTVATEYIKRAFKDHPSWEKICLSSPRFDTWVERCSLRLTQLDTAGYVTGRKALEKFIKDAAEYYCLKRLQDHSTHIDNIMPKEQQKWDLSMLKINE